MARPPLAIATIVAIALLGACTSSPSTTSTPAPSVSPSTSISPTTAAPSETTSPAPSPSPVPSLPAGLPPAFENDVPAGDVPAAALTPLRTEVTGTWRTTTSEGEAVIVAWQVPGPDPFRLARGIVAWRRFDDGGSPWRPVWGRTWGRRAGVLSVDGVVADVTGDGSDDLVLFRGTGGSGACGTAEVVDLAHGAALFARDLCDARLDPSVEPVGLALTEAVFAPGDPHCCPSAMRTTVLVWDGQAWVEETVTETSA